MSDIEKLPLASLDIAAERIEKLKAIFPEAFVEGKVDHDALLRSLGQWVEPGKERFGLNWPGKAECMKVIQTPSVGTLLPMKEESVNFDTTENLIIEGDNLEALKLLQKSYFGKVKMIYIDPPYNTGGEFIYPDNYREGLQEYLRYSGQVDAEGYKLSTNTEAEGRFHSRWLSMLYPRLFLARNLLRDDGVIFVSIDDNEVQNLRMLMNEVFGEENFISVIVIQANKRGQTYKDIAKTHEYILMYSKSDAPILYELEKDGDALPYKDSTGPFDLWELRNRNPKFGRFNRPNLFFPIYVAPGKVDECGYAKISLERSSDYKVEVFPRNSEGEDSCWRWGKDKINKCELDSLSPVLVGKQRRDGEWNIYEKSRKSTTKAKSLWDETEVISEQGTVQLGALGLGSIFDHPKPVGLIEKCLRIATQEDDIVLDFFAGSGTTAHSVMELNKSDAGSRNFILIQLPEKTSDSNYPTIAHVTRERVRRVIKKYNEAEAGKLDFDGSSTRDRGFKSFRLSSSNFKVWEGDADNVSNINDTLSLFAENTVPDRSQEDILYELLLKAGFPLTAPVEKLSLAYKDVYAVAEGALLICLDKELNLEVIEAMVEREPSQILCLDEGFKGNDQLKVNAVQTVKSRNRNEESDIVFRVV